MKHKFTFVFHGLNIHQHIIAGIQEQLYLNDYLVLPNFGGFVLKTQRATFGGGGLSLMPPRKTLGFNVQLKQNDGILSHWLQKQLGCSVAEATKHLEDFSVFCNSILQSKRRLSLDGIGFFYLDFENNICFEPATDKNFLTDSFGLAAITLQAIPEQKMEVKVQEKLNRFATKNVSTQSPANQRKFPAKQAAYVLLVVLLAGTLFTLVLSQATHKGIWQAAVFNNTGKGIYVPVSYSDLNIQRADAPSTDLVADNNGIAELNLGNGKNIAVNVLPAQAKQHTNSPAFGKYEIIFGCFKKLKNAKRLVAKLQNENVDAGIKTETYKGMHVVALSGINDKLQALDALEAIQNAYPKAWLKVN